MENEARSDDERNLQETIDKLILSVETRKTNPETLNTADTLLFLGHIVSILNSEWGTMRRMLKIIEQQQKLLTNPHGENGVTLFTLYEQARGRKKLQTVIATGVIAAIMGISFDIILHRSSEKEANLKRDELIQLLMNKKP